MSFIPTLPSINPFHYCRIPANHVKVDGDSANGKMLIKMIVSLLYVESILSFHCKLSLKGEL